MTKTPWGRADRLRAKRLRPGPRSQPEEASANQRRRLHAATVSVVSEVGYERMRVADLIELSGVSRSAFYKHFDNKHDCFLATLDAIIGLATPMVVESYRNATGPLEQRLAGMLGTLVASVADQPAAARTVWVEGYAAGPGAVERIERLDEQIEDVVYEAFDGSPAHAGMPRDVIRAICGGLRKLVNTRVREGREQELLDLVPELVAWAVAYRAPREPLRRPRRPPRGLVPEPPAPADARDRALAAVTDIVAEGGYPTMRVTEIARRAGISLSTFYDDFSGKEDAFVAAIDRGQQRIFRAVLPVYSAAADWPHAVAWGLHAFFAAFAAEPAMGHLGGVGAYEGGRPAMASRDSGIAAFYAFLEPGYRLAPDMPEIAPEAIGASIYALMTHQVRHRGADRLYELAPIATYMALAPFVGDAAATEIANERPAGSARTTT